MSDQSHPDSLTPPPSREEALPGGRPRVIRLPPYWRTWFGRQSEKRLAVLDELIDERIERRMLRDLLCRLKHTVAVAFVAAAAAAHWFSDQIAWIAERLPVLKYAWHVITGGS